MERDPLRFAWRAALRPNAILTGLALFVGLPLLWIALDIVALAIDSVRATGEGGPRILMRYVIQLPDRIREAPLVLLPGVSLDRTAVAAAVIGGLAGAILLVGLLWFGMRRLGAVAGHEVTTALAERMIESIVSAPLPAVEEARLAASLAGETIGRERRAIDLLATMPVLAGGVLLLMVLHVATTEIPMGIWLALCLGTAAVSARREHELAASQGAAEAYAGSAMRRAVGELARHLPAVAAHGTRAVERVRLAAYLEEARRPSERLADPAARASGTALAALVAAPLGIAAIGAWAGLSGRSSPGAVTAAALAGAVATCALLAYLRWKAALDRLRPVFDELARAVARLKARRRTGSAAALPASGSLQAAEVSATDSGFGRLANADLEIALPATVALCGGPSSGARTFASLLGGQTIARSGHVSLGGVDLDAADPGERARRLAYAGGSTYLFVGSLGANLLYGHPDPDADGLDTRLDAAIDAAGLDRLIERRGLAGTVDPRQNPALADTLIEARGAIRAALDRQGFGDLVEPFDPALYSQEATVGENILFGIALGDTFRAERLPSQPFVKGLLDREGLTKPLAAMGAAIARSDLEMFGGLSDDDSLLGRFALVPAGEREEIEAVLDRRETSRRGNAANRDAERLIGLALRYCEARHRLGLLGPELQERVLKVRHLFGESIPKSLEPAVELFRADRICAAASVRDNLLFGRVAQGRAGATDAVNTVIRAVVRERGLGPVLDRVAFASRVDPADPGMSGAELAAVDLVRCLVRDPDNLVVEQALELLSVSDAAALVRRLMAALPGRGLLVVLPSAAEAGLSGLFDRVVRFDTGRPVAPEAPSPSVREPADVAL